MYFTEYSVRPWRMDVNKESQRPNHGGNGVQHTPALMQTALLRTACARHYEYYKTNSHPHHMAPVSKAAAATH